MVGRRVLVVEDDYDQAQDMARAIEKHGGDVVGPYPDIEAAFLALGKAAIDAAVLDIRLNAEDVFPLADVLREKGIPFFFVTGFDRDVLPKRLRKEQIIRKPIAPFEVLIEVALRISRKASRH
nr:response regulator [Rhizobium aethiopicum]